MQPCPAQWHTHVIPNIQRVKSKTSRKYLVTCKLPKYPSFSQFSKFLLVHFLYQIFPLSSFLTLTPFLSPLSSLLYVYFISIHGAPSSQFMNSPTNPPTVLSVGDNPTAPILSTVPRWPQLRLRKMDRGGGSGEFGYYSVLGIHQDASFSDIRSAYRKLALVKLIRRRFFSFSNWFDISGCVILFYFGFVKKWHPDRCAKNPTCADEANSRFQKIQEAYTGERLCFDGVNLAF